MQRLRNLAPLVAALILILSATTASAGTREPAGRFCLLSLVILGTGAEIGCAASQAPAIDTSCQVFEPIRWSRRDTPETVRQVKEHNASWQALCGDK